MQKRKLMGWVVISLGTAGLALLFLNFYFFYAWTGNWLYGAGPGMLVFVGGVILLFVVGIRLLTRKKGD